MNGSLFSDVDDFESISSEESSLLGVVKTGQLSFFLFVCFFKSYWSFTEVRIETLWSRQIVFYAYFNKILETIEWKQTDLQHRKFTLHVCSTKIQIRLRFHALWRESSLGADWIAKDAKFLLAANEDGSDCTDAQANLSLHWAHIQKVCFMPRHSKNGGKGI